MRQIALSLKHKSVVTFIIIFVALLLGNILPVYSIDYPANHGTNNSMPNQQNSGIGAHDMQVNTFSKSYAEQIMVTCQDENDGNHCPIIGLDSLDKIANRQLVLGTFLDLLRLFDENNYSCHHDGHHLGMWLYGYTGNPKEALKHATTYCGGSVYHGVFQSYFEGEQFIHNLDKNHITITDLCPVGQENINWLHERDCIHAIGHGLVKLYDYDTAAAVDRCNEFVPVWAQSACARGIFMENTEYFVETGKGDFDANDIYSPCDRTVEKFASQCYYYHPAHNLVRNGLTLDQNLTDLFAKCDNISPGEFAKFCYQGIGRLLETIAYTHPELTIAACYLGNQAKYHNDCLLGTLKTILKGDANTEVGFKYCSNSKLDFKASCYEIVGMWIKAFLNTTKLELESECAKAPDVDYAINCINPNQTTGVDVLIFEPI